MSIKMMWNGRKWNDVMHFLYQAFIHERNSIIATSAELNLNIAAPASLQLNKSYLQK